MGWVCTPDLINLARGVRPEAKMCSMGKVMRFKWSFNSSLMMVLKAVATVRLWWKRNSGFVEPPSVPTKYTSKCQFKTSQALLSPKSTLLKFNQLTFSLSKSTMRLKRTKTRAWLHPLRVLAQSRTKCKPLWRSQRRSQVSQRSSFRKPQRWTCKSKGMLPRRWSRLPIRWLMARNSKKQSHRREDSTRVVLAALRRG